MTNVKKMYEEINQLLVDNKNKKVSTILDQLQELMTKKKNLSGQDKTFFKNDEGHTICVFCYYHKRWELVDVCAYGAKASSASGLNTMCKEGVSKWTKQQRVRKQDEANILNKITSGELEVSDIGQAKEDILNDSKVIVPREDEHGFDTLEEAIESN
jgi:undecaprenyl pyrophosphate synthase